MNECSPNVRTNDLNLQVRVMFWILIGFNYFLPRGCDEKLNLGRSCLYAALSQSSVEHKRFAGSR